MMSNKRLVATCAIAFCCNITLLILFIKYNGGERYYITINENQNINAILPDGFLSIGIDASEIEEYNKIDFESIKLRHLAAALAPARLRLGGTASDRLIFSREDFSVLSEYCAKERHSKSVCVAAKKLTKQKISPFFIMTGSQWMQINEFCKATNTTLLFPLNLLIRDDNGWNDKNAKDLLEFSILKNYDIDWQLGNEPNSFHHIFNVTVTPKMLARDFEKLHKLVNSFDYKKSLLVGPDTTRPQDNRPECLSYMVDFLTNASHYINVRSWHQYYLNSRTARLEDFWNPDTFDLLKKQIETMRNHTQNFVKIPMWLSETGTSYGGGAPGLSNSYAGSALWIDKLGLSAKYNITTVIRQSFVGGYYSLVDRDLEPLPDWWLSVLFKKLVGNKVLHVDCNCSKYQRMYIHCTNKKYTNDSTAVTLYAVNLEMAIIRFELNGTAIHGVNLPIDEYIIRAPSNNRKSKTVLLNGWPLYYDVALSELKPRKLKYGRHISMPPYSIGFWVIKNTTITGGAAALTFSLILSHRF